MGKTLWAVVGDGPRLLGNAGWFVVAGAAGGVCLLRPLQNTGAANASQSR